MIVCNVDLYSKVNSNGTRSKVCNGVLLAFNVAKKDSIADVVLVSLLLILNNLIN